VSYDKIKFIKISVDLPENTWIYNLSNKYPEYTFLLKYGHSISDNKRVIFLSVEKNKLDVSDILLFLKQQKDVYHLELIGENIKISFNINFLISLIKDKLTFIYPIVVKRKKANIELFSNTFYIKTLSKIFKKIELIKILDYNNYKDEFELSLRQREVLEIACNLGYFSYPRKISLTELSKYLKISKSNLSEILRIAENKIIHSYFYEK